jgi:hypothetical protein
LFAVGVCAAQVRSAIRIRHHVDRAGGVDGDGRLNLTHRCLFGAGDGPYRLADEAICIGKIGDVAKLQSSDMFGNDAVNKW